MVLVRAEPHKGEYKAKRYSAKKLCLSGMENLATLATGSAERHPSGALPLPFA